MLQLHPATQQRQQPRPAVLHAQRRCHGDQERLAGHVQHQLGQLDWQLVRPRHHVRRAFLQLPRAVQLLTTASLSQPMSQRSGTTMPRCPAPAHASAPSEREREQPVGAIVLAGGALVLVMVALGLVLANERELATQVSFTALVLLASSGASALTYLALKRRHRP